MDSVVNRPHNVNQWTRLIPKSTLNGKRPSRTWTVTLVSRWCHADVSQQKLDRHESHTPEPPVHTGPVTPAWSLWTEVSPRLNKPRQQRRKSKQEEEVVGCEAAAVLSSAVRSSVIRLQRTYSGWLIQHTQKVMHRYMMLFCWVLTTPDR